MKIGKKHSKFATLKMLVLGLIAFTGSIACKSYQKQQQLRESEKQQIEIRERITTIPKYEFDTIFTAKTDTIKIDSVYVVTIKDTVFTIKKDRVMSKITISKNKIGQELIVEPINIKTIDTNRTKETKEIQTIKEPEPIRTKQLVVLALVLVAILYLWKKQ